MRLSGGVVGGAIFVVGALVVTIGRILESDDAAGAALVVIGALVGFGALLYLAIRFGLGRYAKGFDQLKEASSAMDVLYAGRLPATERGLASHVTGGSSRLSASYALALTEDGLEILNLPQARRFAHLAAQDLRDFQVGQELYFGRYFPVMIVTVDSDTGPQTIPFCLLGDPHRHLVGVDDHRILSESVQRVREHIERTARP